MFLKDTVDRNTQQNSYVAANENLSSDGKSNGMWTDENSTRVWADVKSDRISKGKEESHVVETELKGTKVEQVGSF